MSDLNPLAPYTGPRTVTYDQRPQDEAQFRSARLGMMAVGYTLGAGAIVLGIVACLWSLGFTLALASTYGEALKFGLVALGVTLCLCGLPVAAAILSRSYPDEAQRAMGLWMGALAVSLLGVWLFASKLEPDNGPHQVVTGLLGIDRLADGPARRLLAAGLGFISIIGAGMLGRLAVLAMAESYRLAYSEILPPPAYQAEQMPDYDGAGAPVLSPLDIFNMWFQSRIRQEPNGRLQAAQAFQDYQQTCNLNGLPSLSWKSFGKLLTAKAENSGGRIGKQKSGGLHFYTGLAFTGDRGVLQSAMDDDSEFRAVPARLN